MDKTYRIIVWGPGSVGGHALREALSRPELEVVGVRVYSPHKDNVDIGELVGLDPVGIKATTDVDALLSLDADCVIHTPQPLDQEAMTSEVIRLLESGKNVISTAAYHYPPGRGHAYAQRLEDACQRGGASLMGAGLHPPLATSAFVIPLTGMMCELEHIRIVESADLGRVIADIGAHSPFLAALGFGAAIEDLDPEDPAAVVLDSYYDELAAFMALRLFGAQVDELHFKHELTGIPAQADYQVPGIPDLVIPAGKALTVLRTQHAYIGEHHFFTNEDIWYLFPENQYLGAGRELSPMSRGAVNYYVEMTGKPTTMKAEFTLDDDPEAPPIVTTGSVVSVMQSIVPLCHADPGLQYRETIPRYSKDLRDVLDGISATA